MGVGFRLSGGSGTFTVLRQFQPEANFYRFTSSFRRSLLPFKPSSPNFVRRSPCRPTAHVYPSVAHKAAARCAPLSSRSHAYSSTSIASAFLLPGAPGCAVSKKNTRAQGARPSDACTRGDSCLLADSPTQVVIIWDAP